MAPCQKTRPERPNKLLCDSSELEPFAQEIQTVTDSLPRRVNTDPDNVERGLTQLVLTLVELLRQLMERQAIRRIDNGSLTDEEIERLGETFIRLDQRMDELLETFQLNREDLNLNLGPLGDLM